MGLYNGINLDINIKIKYKHFSEVNNVLLSNHRGNFRNQKNIKTQFS